MGGTWHSGLRTVKRTEGLEWEEGWVEREGGVVGRMEVGESRGGRGWVGRDGGG